MRRNKWLLWAAIAGFLSVFIKFLFEVKDADSRSNLLEFDLDIIHYFAKFRSPIINGWAVDVTALGSSFIITTMVLFLVLLFSLRRHWADALQIGLAGVLSGLLSPYFKSLVQRERPPAELHLVQVDNFSYPSGHAMTSALVFLTIGFIFYERYRSRTEKYFCLFSAALLIVLVGMSRIYLGVHYPSDVAGGIAMGVSAALIIFVFRREYQVKTHLPNN